MAQKQMYDTIVGNPFTVLTAPFHAGLDTEIHLEDGSFLPITENTATIWIADWTSLLVIKYTARVSDTLTGVTVVEGYPLSALTATYPVGSVMTKPVSHDDMQTIQDNIRDLAATKLQNKFSATESGKFLKVGSDGSVVLGTGGGPGGSVSFADILGQPTDNTNLNTALSNKVTKHEGAFEIGKDAGGTYIWD